MVNEGFLVAGIVVLVASVGLVVLYGAESQEISGRATKKKVFFNNLECSGAGCGGHPPGTLCFQVDCPCHEGKKVNVCPQLSIEQKYSSAVSRCQTLFKSHTKPCVSLSAFKQAFQG